MAEKNKGGRPKKQLDYDAIEKLSMIQCTQDEIASFLEVNVKTLRADQRFLDLYKKGQEKGKLSLRRYQFKLAEHNTAMAIWLGKQYLGQRDNIDISADVLDEDAISKAIKESFKDVQ